VGFERTEAENRVAAYIEVTWSNRKPTVQLCLHPGRGRHFEISLLADEDGRMPQGLPGWLGGIGLQWSMRRREPSRLAKTLANCHARRISSCWR
jgi:hypothetical protein